MSTHRNTIIIGGGLSGLIVAHKLKLNSPNNRFAILEKSPDTGGVIRSFQEDGFLAEIGPHGFLDNCQESRELLAETGLDRESVKAPLSSFVRYVCMNGRLMMIPQSPMKIIKAPLIPWRDKFRVLGDIFREPLEGEPTVAKWADYRFGKALLPYIDAVFTGTYAGDYNELKIDAVMPGVRALEKQYGSVIRGVIAKARAAKKKNRSGKKLEMPAMTSFPEGMQRLPQKLSELLVHGEELFLNAPATRLRETQRGWSVDTPDTTFHGENLVVALPVNQALDLLSGIDSSLPLRQIPEAWIATVVFGFEGATLPPGFGFLIPEVEKRFTLGTLFSSNMFPNRAPAGTIVFETLVGGKRHPERLQLDDQELIKRSLADIRGLLDLPPTPTFTRVLRPHGGIPQLEAGYPELLNWRNNLVQNREGLFICGFGWDGIGINDMVKTATLTADMINTGSDQNGSETEFKKVYF
jgi:oxygen-dependent protoporphyrinogen oxidase